jgi:hypothetical protein
VKFAAKSEEMPVIIPFTIEIDGGLPSVGD